MRDRVANDRAKLVRWVFPRSAHLDGARWLLSRGFAAHQALGCRGVTRADLRYDDTGDKPALYLLEVNTQPGMTPLSLVPEIAAAAGISFGELVSWMVDDAGCAR